MGELKPKIHDEASGFSYIFDGDYYILVIELLEDDGRPIRKCERAY